jgi:hypothetical protein
MQRHRVRNVKADDLGHDLRALGNASTGETVPARQRIERRLEDVAAGGATDAAVESQGGFLFDRAPARLRIFPLEPAAQQGTKVGELKLSNLIGVPRDCLLEQWQYAKNFHYLIDGVRKNGLNERPRLRKNAPAAVIELVELKARPEGMQEIDRRHFWFIPSSASCATMVALALMIWLPIACCTILI